MIFKKYNHGQLSIKYWNNCKNTGWEERENSVRIVDMIANLCYDNFVAVKWILLNKFTVTTREGKA